MTTTSAAHWRLRYREGLVEPTAGRAPGYVQANLLAVPQADAFDFLLFAQRNPKPCPIIDVVEAGQLDCPAFSGDIRTDIPAYRIYRGGHFVEEVTDVREVWRGDMVGFLIGCSFSFEAALVDNGIRIAHLEQGTNVPMFETNIQCRPAGKFRGPMVVSMRPIPAAQVADAVRITSRYPAVHGAPVHIGDPAAIGITDLSTPDYGDPVDISPGEIPVFWACGVTPQAAVMASQPEFAIGHAPGNMLITDLQDLQYQVP